VVELGVGHGVAVVGEQGRESGQFSVQRRVGRGDGIAVG
jgi:hypothetical protein